MADDDLRARLEEIEKRLTAIEQHVGIAHPSAPVAAPEPPPPPPPPAAPPAAPAPRPTVETVIGVHWLSRIGIAAVLVGAAFFLKLAFDNQWIGPTTRVAIGIVVGVLLLIASDRFHARGHRLFGHSLEVVAVGVLYLSIWAASETYALIGNATAFGAMTIVTAVLVVLAMRHRSEFLGGLALTGGFLTPVLLSTGVNHEVALFAYVALLDAAALLFVAFYPWIRALAVAFFGTLFLWVAWEAQYATAAQVPRTVGFVTLFMLLFAVVPLLRRWEENPLAATALLLLPFANGFVYFAELSWLLQKPAQLARDAVALAALFVAMAMALHLRGDERGDLTAAHVAMALGFVTIAVPLQFHQIWITLGWLAEAAALLLLARTLRGMSAHAFRILGSFALFAAVVRMLFVDRFHPEHLLWNMRALTYAIAVAIFSGIAAASARFRKPAAVILHALALIALTDEISDFFRSSTTARDFGWSALWMLYGAGLMLAGFRLRSSFVRWLALLLIGVTVAKVFFYDLAALERVYRILSFIALGVMLLAISFAYQRKWISVPDDRVQ